MKQLGPTGLTFYLDVIFEKRKRFNTKLGRRPLNARCFPDFFFCRSVKKGSQVVQIFKMKTMCMLCNTVFLSVLLLFDDSGSAGQMHS